MTDPGQFTETRWIDVGPRAKTPIDAIATAGRTGSANARAAEFLWCERGHGGLPRVQLFPSYEAAARNVLDGTASHLLVSNGHPDIATFYEDTNLRFSSAFLHSTPYVLVGDVPLDFEAPRVAVPAGLSTVAARLLAEHFPSFVVSNVGHDDEAVAAVRGDRADVTVLTSDKASACALPVLPGRHTSRMLWTVFLPSAPVQ
ncbi:hypothetical protein [Streptomyces sp. AC627_RSS907]|uniref:hypothetical protein n=1 Tax=Streptomyces sp. AC627_RSS907 TaxID=2823684 RepID=UPI001C21069F|nr:hypothetical protein [Streptomyces sp. AC627_RSS907]